jgi:hypothetical protein
MMETRDILLISYIGVLSLLGIVNGIIAYTTGSIINGISSGVCAIALLLLLVIFGD